MICERCRLDKPQIEFNSMIRYQRPIREPFTNFCATCYIEQASHQDSWLWCVQRTLWRSQFVDKKSMLKFTPYTIDELLAPLLSVVYGVES